MCQWMMKVCLPWTHQDIRTIKRNTNHFQKGTRSTEGNKSGLWSIWIWFPFESELYSFELYECLDEFMEDKLSSSTDTFISTAPKKKIFCAFLISLLCTVTIFFFFFLGGVDMNVSVDDESLSSMNSSRHSYNSKEYNSLPKGIVIILRVWFY